MRNFNKEFSDNKNRKYAYNFDFDIMHNYMIKSLKPFFKGEEILEIGSYKGEFTKKLLPHFKLIECVEPSDEAIRIAKKELSGNITFHNVQIENLKLKKKFKTIVITHVLEHIDNPVEMLNSLKKKFLSDDGRILIVCPNANAPSRQIAVKMGIIPNNSSITEGERLHGHKITYSLDTLERDAVKSGLNVTFRSGIFFKALANFQWDKLINTDIISEEYLEGCYKLGQIYPDLCSSIFIVCEK